MLARLAAEKKQNEREGLVVLWIAFTDDGTPQSDRKAALLARLLFYLCASALIPRQNEFSAGGARRVRRGRCGPGLRAHGRLPDGLRVLRWDGLLRDALPPG
jgi:hypothetical protein